MVMARKLGKTAAQPETTVQGHVSTFVSVKPLDILKEMSGHWKQNQS